MNDIARNMWSSQGTKNYPTKLHIVGHFCKICINSFTVNITGYCRVHVGLRPLVCWDCGFESYRRHGCLSVVSVVCCQVEVSATSWSLVHTSATDCCVSCVIYKPREWGGPGPLGWGGCRSKIQKNAVSMVGLQVTYHLLNHQHRCDNLQFRILAISRVVACRIMERLDTHFLLSCRHTHLPTESWQNTYLQN